MIYALPANRSVRYETISRISAVEKGRVHVMTVPIEYSDASVECCPHPVPTSAVPVLTLPALNQWCDVITGVNHTCIRHTQESVEVIWTTVSICHG